MKLCMIGTGYVGLVSGVCFSDLGNKVICVDKNKDKINLLNKGKIPIYEPGLDEMLKRNFKFGRISFSTNIDKAIQSSDIIFICVGTPTSKKNNSADLTHVYKVANDIKKNIKKFKIIVAKSTVPITTGDKIEKIIAKKISKKKFEVVSNPEFLREGEAIRDFVYPDRIVIGTQNKKVNRVLKNLYEPLINKGAKYLNTSRRAAELIKYASNAFLATKITYINEISNLCEKIGVNVEDISIGMGLDKRIGTRFLRAGPAYGGSCFPKDTKAIAIIGDQYKSNLSIIKSTIKSNENRRDLFKKKVFQIMENKIKNKVITFLGVTFKANTDDMRESVCLKMIPFFLRKGAKLRYYDPSGEKKEINKKVKFCKNIQEACLKSDLIIIHTEWNEFKSLDFKNLVKKNNFKIYDMRNIYSSIKMNQKKINYFSVGR